MILLGCPPLCLSFTHSFAVQLSLKQALQFWVECTIKFFINSVKCTARCISVYSVQYSAVECTTITHVSHFLPAQGGGCAREWPLHTAYWKFTLFTETAQCVLKLHTVYRNCVYWNWTMYTKTAHCIMKIHSVYWNHTLYTETTQCLLKLHYVIWNSTLYTENSHCILKLKNCLLNCTLCTKTVNCILNLHCIRYTETALLTAYCTLFTKTVQCTL